MAVSTIDALYHSGSEKLTTSATGITVTGTVAATAYTGDGSALTGTGSPSIDDNGDATAMTITSDENIGIGTATAHLGQKLTVAGGIAVGTSASKSIIADFGETNLYLINYNTDSSATMRFHVGGGSASAERMRIDSSGRAMFGTTTAGVSGAEQLTVASTGNTGVTIRAGSASSSSIYMSDATSGVGEYAGYIAYAHGSDSMGFATNGSERMRIDSSGNVLINRTSELHGGRLCLDYVGGTDAGIVLRDTTSSGTGVPMQFANGATTIIGSITHNQSSTSFNTSSDYRLKENVVDLTGASARVNQLNPLRFNWIIDETNTAIDGFLAHEVADVVPEAITGTKDAMKDEPYEITPAVLDDDGNVTTEAVMGTRSVPDYQGIDQSKLVPLLTAALQEALAEITSLKTRVEALEA